MYNPFLRKLFPDNCYDVIDYGVLPFCGFDRDPKTVLKLARACRKFDTWSLECRMQKLFLPFVCANRKKVNESVVTCLFVHDGKIFAGHGNGCVVAWDSKADSCEDIPIRRKEQTQKKRHNRNMVMSILPNEKERNEVTCLSVHDDKIIAVYRDRAVKSWRLNASSSGVDLTELSASGIIGRDVTCQFVHNGKVFIGHVNGSIGFCDLENKRGRRAEIKLVESSHLVCGYELTNIANLSVHDDLMVFNKGLDSITIVDLKARANNLLLNPRKLN